MDRAGMAMARRIVCTHSGLLGTTKRKKEYLGAGSLETNKKRFYLDSRQMEIKTLEALTLVIYTGSLTAYIYIRLVLQSSVK
jgi:hypothetical protein